MTSPEPRFTTGPTLKHVAVMTLTGAMGLTLMFVVDVATLFWVSRLGDESLVAALGLAWVIQYFTISFGIGFAIATTALVGKALGARRRDEARGHATSTVIMSAALMFAVSVLVVVFRAELVSLIASDGGRASEIAQRFLLLSVPSLPIMGVGIVASAVLRAEGDAYRAMSTTLVMGVVASILDPLFIFTFGLGIDGAAIVIGIARVAAAVLGLYFVIHTHNLMARPAWRDLRATLRPFFAISMPAVLTQLSTPFGNFVLTGVIASFGESAVAGWAVMSRLMVLAFGGIFSLSGAVGGIISQNFGAGRIDRVRATYRDAIYFNFAYVAITWGLLAVGTGPIIVVFDLSPEAADVVRAFNYLAAGGFAFTGMIFVSSALFNNLGRPLWSTWLNWLRDGLLMWPLALLMSGMFAAQGVVYAQAVASVLVGVLSWTIGWRFVNRLRTRSAVHLQNADTSATFEPPNQTLR